MKLPRKYLAICCCLIAGITLVYYKGLSHFTQQILLRGSGGVDKILSTSTPLVRETKTTIQQDKTMRNITSLPSAREIPQDKTTRLPDKTTRPNQVTRRGNDAALRPKDSVTTSRTSVSFHFSEKGNIFSSQVTGLGFILWSIYTGHHISTVCNSIITSNASRIYWTIVSRGGSRIPRRRWCQQTSQAKYPKTCMKLRTYWPCGGRGGGGGLISATGEITRAKWHTTVSNLRGRWGHVPSSLSIYFQFHTVFETKWPK